MRYVIDRIECGMSILECLKTKARLTLNASELPNEAKEGDVLDEKEGVFRLNKKETNKRREKIEHLMNTLHED